MVGALVSRARVAAFELGVGHTRRTLSERCLLACCLREVNQVILEVLQRIIFLKHDPIDDVNARIYDAKQFNY